MGTLEVPGVDVLRARPGCLRSALGEEARLSVLDSKESRGVREYEVLQGRLINHTRRGGRLWTQVCLKMIGLGSKRRERKGWGGKQKKEEENGLMLLI